MYWPTTNLDAPSRHERSMRDRRAAKCDTLPHARVASVEPPWLETTHFQECVYMHDVLCNVTARIM